MVALAKNPIDGLKIAEILRAVAHPVRIRIIAALCVRPTHVKDLSAQLKAPQAIISQQLKILRMKKLVKVERRDGFAYYELAEPHLRDLICCINKCKR